MILRLDDYTSALLLVDYAGNTIEIINNTRAGIVFFFRSKKGNAQLGANSSSRYFDIGSRTKDLRSFHRVFIL